MLAGQPPPGSAGIHPASLILIWLGFALCIPWLRASDLAVIAGMLVIALLLDRSPDFFKLLRRTRWLLLSLILVYAFATPGDPLIPALDNYSPSREGLISGGSQALRLAALLAGLAALLSGVSRNRILAGLYFLLRPLSPLRVDIDRIAARVWLTLYYAEQKELGRPREWRATFHAALDEGGDGENPVVSLEIGRLSGPDYLALVLSSLLLGLLVARGAA
ncbi:MAG: CbiQ family ECF transporter T component [Sulfuricella sp.]|nr:CbiQ family ECF transporter T component [Sulfuricella sp.]